MNINEFRNSNILKSIKSNTLKSGTNIKTELPSGCTLELQYKYDDGIMDAAKRLKMGFPLCVLPKHSITKTVTKPNGVKLRSYHTIKNNQIVLEKRTEKYPEGVIDIDYKNNKIQGGLAWLNNGEIIWKFKGHPEKPTSTEPFTDPEYAINFDEIKNYIKQSAATNTYK